ncbi:MAG: hypothetical protein MUF20_07655 [Methylotetracoccus sp.]|jgi:hypothetical protein|nr:hypothetical protein [Methylotetracoccus sp.]
MWDFSLLTALQSVEKSMAFVLHRWLVFLGVAAGFLLSTLAGAGTAVGMGSLSANPLLFAHSGAIAGFALFAWLAHTLRPTLYRAVRAPHLLLLAKLSRQDAIPEGRAQVELACRSVADQVPDPHLLWEIRRAACATMAQLPRRATPAGISATARAHASLLDKAQRWLCAMNVDLIIAAIVDAKNTNPWRSAQSGILLQAKNLSVLSKNRLALTAFEGLGWLLGYLLLLLAFQKIAAALPFPTGFWPHVFAFLFAWNIKASFLEPTTQAAMMQLRLQPPDVDEVNEIAAKLAADSETYRLIEARAASPATGAEIA